MTDHLPDGIAIIGMAGRFPGAKSVQEFWDNLAAGRESITFFDGGSSQAARASDLSARPYVAARGILDRPEWFDAAFFGMSPIEAEVTDPQQRVFLEVAWEAFEHAGYDPTRYAGSIGVYAGVGANTYYPNYVQPASDLREAAGPMLELIGRDKDFIATRVAYKFNLRGPALNINTACSTSLVVVCHAVQALLTFQCDMALAGGASIVFPQETGYFFEEEGILSPDGHTRAFDAAAQGTVFSSGAAAVVLKRLSDALADGDEIYAVITGAALNNDGSNKASFTAPSAKGQAEVIALAQSLAGVDPRSISYVEAHGTATPIGDPIEVAGLTEAFRLATADKQFCAIGSLKSNVGHLDIAAGVAGLIKTALALKYRQLPPSLFYERPNPAIDFANSPFYVNTCLRGWDAPYPRRAGVSSFGVGGTNAHVVVEEAPVRVSSSGGSEWQVLPLSAMSSSALDVARQDFERFLKVFRDEPLADVAHTLQVGRKELPWRSVVVASSSADAAGALASPSSPRLIKSSTPAHDRSLVFMFPGGGAQYPGAARDLYESNTAFRDRVDASTSLLDGDIGAAVKRLIRLTPHEIGDGDRTLAERPSVGLPLLVLLEHAMAEQWRAFGVTPSALIGHSVGEYTAACIAGVFSIEDALALVQLRGRLFDGMPPGAMLSVAGPVEMVTQHLAQGLDLAVVNGPSSCVVSGPVDRIDPLAARLTDLGFETVKLHIAVAAHSAMVEPVLPEFRALLQRTPLRPPTVPFVSNVTGEWITDEQATDPEYWVRHLRHTVQFSKGLEKLFALPHPLLLEVGPGRVLAALARQHPARPSSAVAVESMRHFQDVRDDREALLSAAGRLWVSGAKVNWGAWSVEPRRRVALPTYPFERKRFMANGSESTEGPQPALSSPRVPLAPAPEMPAPLPASTVPAPAVSPTVVPRNMPQADRKTRILDELTSIMQRLSGVDRAALDADATFLDLGFESLLLGQVSLAINRTFGVRVRFRHFFEETPTLRRLADYLDQQMPADKFAPPAVDAPPVAAVQASIIPPSVVATPILSQLTMPVADSAGPVGSNFLEAVIHQQLDLMRQQLAALGGAPAVVTPQVPAAAPVAAAHVPPSAAAPGPPTTAAASSTPRPDRPSTLKLFGGVSRGEADGRWKPIPKGEGGGLTPAQEAHLATLAKEYNARTKTSKAMAQRARTHLVDPRGVAGFGPIWKELVYQIASNGSAGSKLWDVDGNEYVDVTMGFGSALFGHAPSFMTEAMNAQLSKGYEVGLHSPLTGQVAELFCEMTGTDRVCFCTSGTDAVIGALRAARAVTGKDRIATFIGDIHGRLDEVLGRPAVSAGGRGSMPLAAGIPEHIVGPVLTLEYGVPESLDIIRAHASELAAVLVEPVRTRQPDLQPVEFLRELRQITQENEIALVMDEVVTGFRVSQGGAQKYFGIEGDISTWGKAAAGGMPIGMISGRADFMNVLDGGVWHYGDSSTPETPMTNFGGSGTFGKHPLSMIATLACLKHLKSSGPGLQDRLNARTSAFVQKLNQQLRQEQFPLHVEHFSSFFLPRVLGDRRFEALLFHHLRKNGVHIYLDYPCFLSTAHTDADLNFVIEAFLRSCRAMREGGCLSDPDDDGNRGPGPGRSQEGRIVDEAVRRKEQEVRVEPVGVQASSAGQVEIWLAASRGEQANLAFNQIIQIELGGRLDVGALQRSVEQVIVRHEALRAVFSQDGQHFQIKSDAVVDLAFEDLEGLDADRRAFRLTQILTTEAGTPFDLSGRLVRAKLIRLAGDKHVLVFAAHHLVCDGWSLGMVTKDLGILYSAATGGATPTFDSHMQFSEFLAMRDHEEVQEAESYWFTQFKDGAPVLELPTDRPRPPMRAFGSRSHRVVVDKKELESLRRATLSQQCTLFTFLVSAYGALLHRLSGQDDVVIGVAAAGQASTGCDDLIGHCVSTLPTRSRLPRGSTVGDYVASVRGLLLDAYDHQQFTFSSLLPRLRLAHDAARVPLVSTLLTHETETKGINFANLTCTTQQVARHSAIFDIELYAIESDDELALTLWLNTGLFDEETGRRWLGYYKRLLMSLAQVDLRVAELPMMSAEERHQLMVEWGKRSSEHPPWASAYSLFENRAREGSRVALTDELGSITYEQLELNARRVAEALTSRGIGSGHTVAIAMRRTRAMVAAVLGILRSGAAYLPVDSQIPQARLDFIARDAQPALLLTDLGTAMTGVPGLEFDDIAKTQPTTSSSHHIEPEAPAYVIYTSGSSGQPKGVRVPHRALVNFLHAMTERPGMSKHDVVLAQTTLSFDIAALEVLLPLICGARVVIAQSSQATDGRSLIRLIEREQVTVMQATPATWRLLLEAGWEGASRLRMICGGEALTSDLARDLLERGAELWNAYGPTETTIWSSINRVTDPDRISIGQPIDNTQLLVLDGDSQLAPTGLAGELYIGGAGVALGYLNRPELTAERFVKLPSSTLGERAYRTGDLVRYRSDGTLEFLGRLDNQVKLRGYRIELGEIEHALLQHPQVLAAVVLLQTLTDREPRLMAYVTVNNGIRVEDLREFLQLRLPQYMVPSGFVVLDAMPLTRSGKIDRRALATITAANEPEPVSERPLSATESQLAEIWTDLLSVERVGAESNFFELGGHSLLAMRMVSRIHERFNKQLPLGTLFEHRTLARLAALIATDTNGAARPARTLVVLRESHSNEPPLFLVHAMGGEVWSYAPLANALPTERQVYGIQADSWTADELEGLSVAGMAAKYISAIRTVQPSGPYYLGGFCAGSVVAYEMAQQLSREGDLVGLLAIIDHIPGGEHEVTGVFASVRQFFANIPLWIADDLIQLDGVEIGRRLASKFRLLKAHLTGSAADVRDRLGMWRLPDHQVPFIEACHRAIDQYRLSHRSGRMALLRARSFPSMGPWPKARDFGWNALTGDRVEVVVLPGSHGTLIGQPFVRHLAVTLDRLLRSAHRDATTRPTPSSQRRSVS